MNKEPTHLGDKAKSIITLNCEDRIEWLFNERWIGYPKAKEIIDQLEHLYHLPRKSRLPGMLLVGDTNNGKSSLVNRFASKYVDRFDPEEELAQIPILTIQAPSMADENAFYERILQKLFMPYRKSGGAEEKCFQVTSILKKSTVRMLVIEEFNNLATGRPDKQRQLLNAVKNLSNELMINIVGVGVHEAQNAIRSDPQLTNRLKPTELPRWKLDKDFLRLLASFEQALPLKRPSQLSRKELAVTLLSMSEGYIGELSYLLELAAQAAIRRGEEQITSKTLQLLNWIPPSKR